MGVPGSLRLAVWFLLNFSTRQCALAKPVAINVENVGGNVSIRPTNSSNQFYNAGHCSISRISSSIAPLITREADNVTVGRANTIEWEVGGRARLLIQPLGPVNHEILLSFLSSLWDFAHQQEGEAEDPFTCISSEPTMPLKISVQSCGGTVALDWTDVDAALEGLYYAMPYSQNNHALTFELLDPMGRSIAYGDLVAVGGLEFQSGRAFDTCRLPSPQSNGTIEVIRV